jgi:hypothetical protein
VRPRLTYANVVSSLALFLALGGVSWAAVTLPKDSVGAKQIKAGAVGSAELADGAVKRDDLAAGALPVAGPQGERGPAGATGATGATGPQGPAGPVGPAGDIFDPAQFAGAVLPNNQRMVLTIDGFTVITGLSYRSSCPAPGKCRLAIGGLIPSSLEANAWLEQARNDPSAAKRSFSLQLQNNVGATTRRFHVTNGIPIALVHQADQYMLIFEADSIQQIAA